MDPTVSDDAAVPDVRLGSWLNFERTSLDQMARTLTTALGSVRTLFGTILFILFWIAVNLGIFGIIPFDPYPFDLLIIIVSIAAMLFAIVVLISQNRESGIAEVRQQIDFEINVRTEREVTKILHMLDTPQTLHGATVLDLELEEMKEETIIADIKKVIEDEIAGSTTLT